MSDKHLSDLTFSSLGLHPAVMQGVEDAGFDRCTPIQAQTLPIALTGKDVAGQAQTGTGKTAAFLLALFQNLLTNAAPPTRSKTGIRAICIAPTRSLTSGSASLPQARDGQRSESSSYSVENTCPSRTKTMSAAIASVHKSDQTPCVKRCRRPISTSQPYCTSTLMAG